jgi:type IV pilus assembly protein PilY1
MFFFMTFIPVKTLAIDIADHPIELSYKAASPIVMVVLDDSSSMDLEFITPENDGTFNNNFYIYHENPGDNVYTSTLNYMMEYERKTWKSQWHGYNTLFYNPGTVYTPWPDPSGTGTFPDADTARPRSNPMKPDYTLNLDGNYLSIRISGLPVDIKNSHYYILDDRDSDGEADAGENLFLISISKNTRFVYRVSDNNNDGRVDDNELSPVDRSLIPEHLRPSESVSADLQNFANWYSFYRRRSLTAKAAVARTITGISGMNIGFYSINKNLIQKALPVRVTDKEGNIKDSATELLTRLYNLKSRGSTPLREGLNAVGKYYQGLKPEGLGESPYALKEDGGECQRVYALAMTDGYWTESSFSLSSPDPDQDGYGNTLADVAYMYFFKDLRPDLADLLFPLECDTGKQQHMVTFSLSFGLVGTLNPKDYIDGELPCSLKNDYGDAPAWPNPFCNNCKAKIDDLWHAAANTYGSFFNAANVETLVTSLGYIFGSIQAKESTAAQVTVAAESFYSSTTLYQAFYNSDGWTGDVAAHTVRYDDNSKAVTIESQPLWRAAEKLNERSAESRNIIGFDGTKAIAFTWNELSDTQKTLLNQNQDLLSYLRGKEVPAFRKRRSKLGDIVHASPLLAGNHVYVGANDGMLHVFDAKSGEESFAYVPNLVFPGLRTLSDTLYTHRFFVDQTPVCSDILIKGKKKAWLVGGLGKGGKGYYCLDISDVDNLGSFSPENLKPLVQWEFKHDTDLGFTFSEPVIVRTKSTEHEYVAVFGNGYNSAGGFARLFILDAVTGEVLRNLDTEKGEDNGLSTPIVTDVNNDGKGDYIYAGDLKGHLWKWDLRSGNPLSWDFSYRDKTGRPAPLFKTPGNQPITTRPDVMRHPTHHGYMVCFGTGKFLGTSDLYTENIQSAYGIWDYGDDPGEYLGEFNSLTRSLSNHPDSESTRVRLAAQTITATEMVEGLPVLRTTTQNPVDYTTIEDANDPNPNQVLKKGLSNPARDAGWCLNFSASERVHQNVRIWNNVLIVLGRTPSILPCRGGGSTLVYFLNPATGSMIDEAICVDTPSPVTPPVIVTTPAGDKMIFEKDRSVLTARDDGVKSGIYFWRQLF